MGGGGRHPVGSINDELSFLIFVLISKFIPPSHNLARDDSRGRLFCQLKFEAIIFIFATDNFSFSLSYVSHMMPSRGENPLNNIIETPELSPIL